ncbi:MAG: hypothetical protein JNN07_00050 [Verrucomicrobiales bacterium]|nr:hypothetical protein [Verrucomicrobiales bacterium]
MNHIHYSLSGLTPSRLRRYGSFRSLALLLLALVWAGCVGALPIPVPNGSFESPPVIFVSTEFDAWQKNAKPDGYPEDDDGFLWSQLTGQFKNPAPGAFDRLENCDGDQAVWVFAIPGVGIFQDLIPWNPSGSDSNSSVARFRVGSSYQLAAGVIGGGGGMSNGAPLQLSIYYRDGLSNRVTLASTVITNSRMTFPTLTRLVEFQVETPEVRADDAWVGQPIGIAIDSTVSPELEGGYWDVDAVRLTERAPLRLQASTVNERGFRFEIQSEIGLRIAVLASARLTAPVAEWTQFTTLTNVTGSLSFTSGNLDGSSRFFRAQALPSE